MRQLIDRYLEEHAAKLAKRNRDDQASMLRKLVEPAWGPRKAAEIQPDDVDRLLRQNQMPQAFLDIAFTRLSRARHDRRAGIFDPDRHARLRRRAAQRQLVE